MSINEKSGSTLYLISIHCFNVLTIDIKIISNSPIVEDDAVYRQMQVADKLADRSTKIAQRYPTDSMLYLWLINEAVIKLKGTGYLVELGARVTAARVRRNLAISGSHQRVRPRPRRHRVA